MPVMTRLPRERSSAPPDYKIVLAPGNGAEPRPQAFAKDADQATVIFDTILHRLCRQQQSGELQLCDLRKEGRVILRAPVAEDAASQ
jgi:hypothetical protein